MPSGTVLFNQLIATSGVKSIELNGFILSNQVSPAVSTPTGVFLYGGVKTLSFQDIQAAIDTTTNPTPYQIVIGNANTPLKVAPSIYLNSIHNLVYTSDESTTIPTTPVTTPSVQLIVNGAIKNFDITSASQGSIQNFKLIPPALRSNNSENTGITAGYQFWYPVVGTTGRTAVQATAVNKIHVHGSAVNFTVSHASQPFTSSTSGLTHLHKAVFDGTADGVGIDVNGPIGKLDVQEGARQSQRRLHRPRGRPGNCSRRRATGRTRLQTDIPPRAISVASSRRPASSSSSSGRPTPWQAPRRTPSSSSSPSRVGRPMPPPPATP